MTDNNLRITYESLNELRPSEYNPRLWTKEATDQLKESIEKFGIVDPFLVNSAPGREGIVIGGHFRLHIAKELGITTVPVVRLNIPDLEKEQELNLRLNKNTGEWDWNLLKEFGENFLSTIGFSSEDIDTMFGIDETPEVFDLEYELKKLDIEEIQIKKGDVWALGEHRLMCGDSTVEADINKLMDGTQADMCLTDPPYILDYLKGKKKTGSATTGFGYKRDRRYLETDVLPNNFTELWMKNIAAVAKSNFSIICYENWKNIRTIWNEMEKYWKVRNMIVWHVPNRVQGYAATNKFFNKHDIALVGSSPNTTLHTEAEETLLQNEYEIAMYAIKGKPHWESYGKGKKFCPTDFISCQAADKKSSGQGIIFGTKPLEILIPYIKVLSKRDDFIIEPFGGSGSTLIAAEKMKRRCNIMEKSPVYAEVIKKRWETLTKSTAIKL